MKKIYRDEKGRFCKVENERVGSKTSSGYDLKTARYRDENGRFCKRHQTPEQKAKDKARKQTSEYKAKEKARKQTSEYKAKARARDKVRGQTPKRKAEKKKYREDNLEKIKEQQKTCYQTNPKKYKDNSKRWKTNPENKGKVNAIQALNRAKRLKRHMLLDEAGRKAIAEIYKNCPDDWHVDHIAPLLGKTISGLHLPENLQYLPEWVNYMKGNRWEESWIEHTIDTPLEEKIKAYQLNYEGEKWHE